MTVSPASIPSSFKKEEFSSIGDFHGDYPAAKIVQIAYGDVIRFCPEWKTWLVWYPSEGVWKRRDSDSMCDLVGKSMEIARSHTDCLPSDKVPTFLETERSVSRWVQKRKSVVKALKTFPELEISPDIIDQEHDLFNANNGVIDLHSGKLMPFDKSYYFTKKSKVNYVPNTYGSTFHNFIDTIFRKDREMVSYVQKLAGYSMTGLIRQHILPIWYGSGANGKGTLMESLLAAFGDFASVTDPNIILEHSEFSHPANMADLFGKRLVFTNETNANIRISEARVKMLTGGDRINARRLYENFWHFSPTHKLMLVTNHLPDIEGMDNGIWRRIHLIGFEKEFKNHERDDRIREKIMGEMEAVLSWAATGAKNYLADGLEPCKAVRDASDNYRRNCDDFALFLEEHGTVDHSAKIRASDLYERFAEWYKVFHGKEISMARFGRMMTQKEKSYNVRRVRHGKCFYYVGIDLNDKDTFDPPEEFLGEDDDCV